MNGVYRGMLIVGCLLIVLSGVFVLGDSDNMANKMPTQVLPRRYAGTRRIGHHVVLLGLRESTTT